MIILDTNVVSEAMRTGGSSHVRQWLDRQRSLSLFVTATTLSELLLGIEILPTGRRKTALAAILTESMTILFGERVLPFDWQAAVFYAELAGRARAAGTTISVADGQIAAIAAHRGFLVATRDTGPFEAAGIRVINPWTV